MNKLNNRRLNHLSTINFIYLIRTHDDRSHRRDVLCDELVDQHSTLGDIWLHVIIIYFDYDYDIDAWKRESRGRNDDPNVLSISEANDHPLGISLEIDSKLLIRA